MRLKLDRPSQTVLALAWLLLIGITGCGGGSSAATSTSNSGGGSGSGSSGGSTSGSGTSSVASISPASLTFAIQNTNTSSASQSLTLSNTGTANLAVTSISSSGDFTESNSCGTSVAAGASCTIQVAFDPTAPGTRLGTVTIQDNSANSPQIVPLTGTGNLTTTATIIATDANGKTVQLPFSLTIK